MADSAAAATGDGGILEVCFQLPFEVTFIITLKQKRSLPLYSLLCWNQTQLLHRTVICMQILQMLCDLWLAGP